MQTLQALFAYVAAVLLMAVAATSPFWWPERQSKTKPLNRTEPLNKWVAMVDWDGPSLVEVTMEPDETFTLRRIGKGNKTLAGIDNAYEGLTAKELAAMSI